MAGGASNSRSRAVVLTAILLACATLLAQQAPPPETLARIGGYVERYYTQARSIVAEETVVIQPVGRDLAADGFARTAVYELRVEWNPLAERASERATAVRTLVRSSGPPLFEKGKEACADPPAITPEPLSFLLPANQGEFVITLGKPARHNGRRATILEFTERDPEPTRVSVEGPCTFAYFPAKLRTRVWADAMTAEILRVDESLTGVVDIRVPREQQGKDKDLPNTVNWERADTSIRYRGVKFSDPDEELLLPASIETLQVYSAAYGRSVEMRASRLRRTQTFRHYRRFVTGSRILQ